MIRSLPPLILLLTLAPLACISRPPANLKPLPDPETTQLSGEYVFDSVDACVRGHLMDLDEMTFLPVDEIKPGSTVSVDQEPGVLRIRYVNHEGKSEEALLSLEDAQWRKGRLMIPIDAGVRIYPGLTGERRSCAAYRSEDGSLVLVNGASETGLAMFMIPFHERREVVLRLRPAESEP
ncbi:MAG TPA: hypothetical protein VM557_13315 [Thermoanaerobaculia bacterium]|nr:hypothetical protein [Thermoanaerobaculia bacterium]